MFRLDGEIRLKSKYHINNLLGIRGGSKNLPLVLLERPEPMLDVRSVLGNVGGYA
jgi:hypothetical protein